MEQISNDVILEKLDGLKTLFTEKFDNNSREHKIVIAHQEKTNGRVTKLETWRAFATGGFLIVQLIVVPFAWIIIEKILK